MMHCPQTIDLQYTSAVRLLHQIHVADVTCRTVVYTAGLSPSVIALQTPLQNIYTNLIESDRLLWDSFTRIDPYSEQFWSILYENLLQQIPDGADEPRYQSTEGSVPVIELLADGTYTQGWDKGSDATTLIAALLSCHEALYPALLHLSAGLEHCRQKYGAVTPERLQYPLRKYVIVSLMSALEVVPYRDDVPWSWMEPMYVHSLVGMVRHDWSILKVLYQDSANSPVV